MGRDTQIGNAVHNEDGIKPTHHARGSGDNNELHRV